MILGIIAAASNLIIGGCYGLEGKLLQDGQLTFDCLNLMVGILFTVIVAALLIHDRRDKKEETEE